MADLTVDALLNLTLGSVVRGKSAEKEIANAVSEATRKGYAAGMGKGAQEGANAAALSVKKEMAPTISKLLEMGFRKAGDELEAAVESSTRKQMRTVQKMALIEKRLQEEEEKQEDQALIKRLKLQKEAKKKEYEKEKKGLKKLIDIADKDVAERIGLMEEAQKRADKSMKETVEESGETFNNVVSNALSADNLKLDDLVKSLGKGISGMMTNKVGNMALAGEGATEAGAGMMARLGTMSVAITGLAASVAAVIALMAAAYGQAKEMNKALVDGAGAANLLSKDGGGLAGSLAQIRRMSIDVARELNVTKEETMGVITAFTEAGITLREFEGIVGGTTSTMEAMTEVTKTAILASQALGVSVSDIASLTNNMTRDLGYNLNNVKGAFGMIYDEAGRAGIGTKAFFATILETTSGMALYNYRLEETLGLLTDMTKALGEDAAKEKIKMQGEFKSMGMQDRLKATMLSGGKMEKVAKADAKAQGSTLAASFAQKGVVGAAGITKDGSIDVEKLGKMSNAAYNELYAGISAGTDQDADDARRQLESLRGLSKVYQGGSMATAQSLADLSKGGEMAAQLSKGFGLIGKPISEATAMDEMILEQALGMSAEEISTNKRLDRSFRKEFADMQARGEATGKSFEEALAGGLLAQSDTMKEAQGMSYSLTEKLGIESLQETRSMSQILSNTIASVLESIYSVMQSLYRVFVGEFGEDSADKVKAESDARTSADAAREKISSTDKLIGEANDKLRNGDLEVEDRKALKQVVSTLLEEKAAAKQELSRAELIQKGLGGGLSVEEAKVSAEKGIFKKENEGMDPKEFVKTLTQDQKISAGMGVRVSAMRGKNHPKITDPDGTVRDVELGSREEWDLQALVEKLVKSGDMTVKEAKTQGYSVTVDDQAELTSEQIKAAADMAKKKKKEDEKAALKRKKEEAEAAAKVKTDEDKKTTDLIKSQDSVRDAVLSTAYTDVSGATGLEVGEIQSHLKSEDGKSQLIALMKKAVDAGELTKQEGRDRLAAIGIQNKLEDFVYRGDSGGGTITPINNYDQLLGMKPGGPVDKTMGSGGGGNKTVYININGGDLNAVRQVVTKVLQDTGYGDMRSYKP